MNITEIESKVLKLPKRKNYDKITTKKKKNPPQKKALEWFTDKSYQIFKKQETTN